MNDIIVSWIRTVVPAVVSAGLLWLGDTLGIVGVDSEAAAVTAVTLILAVYYAAARYAETRWPVVGFLLGSRRTPTYTGENVPL